MNVADEVQPVIELSGVHKKFGEIVALDGVDLSVARGEVVCVIGPSGCGKSTLLRTINWLEVPDGGQIVLEGNSVGTVVKANGKISPQSAKDLNRTRSRMGMVFQQFNLWPHLSVLENVTRAQKVVLQIPKEEAELTARSCLRQVGLSDKMDALPDQLSGGQQQRVAIARALSMSPTLMLMDEPTSALDPELVGDVLGVLQKLAEDGMTMVIVTHELGFAAKFADRILFMDRGLIVEEGVPQQILQNPETDRLKLFLKQLGEMNLTYS
ncbi:MAG: amino acid ABC transporter ATP-binding protein [Dehalococcoidia bacterium]|jgi:polar amino acid transport system ATP-binding protein|nr:amino acid ABC transporter ATP-binding protein [Arenicellales bacterium]MDP7674944.1 amino acid ABC transporter ATP-binding protein [Dehalococcoidia bacterium]|tara:strand:+ start:2627 stop:3430 length:804 start_codon:yes stop_codon:yes gene_type:complete